MYGKHGCVPRRICADRRLRIEHVRFASAGHGRPSGAAQLRAGLLHARGERPARSHGFRRDRVARVRPEPSAPVRIARRRRFRRP